MANRIATHILKNSNVVNRPLPTSLLGGEPIVNTADGIVYFSGVTSSTNNWVPAGTGTTANFFEAGSNLYDLQLRNRITKYEGATGAGLAGKFLSGTTNGFVLANISSISGIDTYVTGFTYSNNVATIKQNQGQADLSILINTMTGLTVNGTLSATTGNIGAINTTTLNATGGTVTTLGSTTATLGTANITNANINTLGATAGTVTTLGSTTATLGTANITTENVNTLNATGATITTLGSTTANITNANVNTLGATAGTVTTLGSTTATLGTANITTGNVTTLGATGGTITTLGSTTANLGTSNITTLNATGGTVTTLGSTTANLGTANVTTLNATGGTITTLGTTTLNLGSIASYGGATNVAGQFLSGTTSGFVLAPVSGITGVDTFVTGFTYANNVATIKRNQGQADLSILINTMTGLTVNGTLSATTGNIGAVNTTTLNATGGTVTTLGSTTANLGTANVTTLNATGGTVTTLGSTTATLGTANITTENVNTLNATGATITTLGSTTATLGTANIATLGATAGTVTTLGSTTANLGTANVTTLNATGGTVTTLNSTTATIGTNNVTTENVTTLNATGGTVTTLNSTTLNLGKIATYNGLTNVAGQFLSGTTTGFVLAPISGITGVDTFVTGFTYSPTTNTITLSQNQGQADKTVTINTVSGLTVSDLTANRLVYTTTSGKLLTGTATFDGTNMALPTAGSLTVGTGGLTVGSGGSPGTAGTGDVVINGSLTVFGASVSAFTSQLYVEDNNITLNYNPTGNTTATSIGSGWNIQDGNGVSNGTVNLDIRAMNTFTGITSTQIPSIAEYGGSTGYANRAWVTQLNDVVIRSTNVTTPNGVRVLAEFDVLDGGTY